MTKVSGGSERMRLNVLIVEVVCGVCSHLCDLQLCQHSHRFFRGMLPCLDRKKGGRNTLAGRPIQRYPAVNY